MRREAWLLSAAQSDGLDDGLHLPHVARVPVRLGYQGVDLEEPAWSKQVGALQVEDRSIGPGHPEDHLLAWLAIDGDALGLAQDVDLETGRGLDGQAGDVR